MTRSILSLSYRDTFRVLIECRADYKVNILRSIPLGLAQHPA